jgi:putative transposase
LKDGLREDVIFHILNNSRSKNIYIDHINGFKEHLHALISLGASQNISDIMKNIKGESSFWINRNKLTDLKFEWQDDYYAVSIGNS